MIKNTIYFISLLAAMLFHAQSTTENFVQLKECLDADCIKRIETVQYFDGLGRPKQVVGVKSSPLGRDTAGYIEYDGFGRQVKDFLSVPQSNTLNGDIVPDPLTNAPNTPYGQEKIYAEKIIESSPLNRVLQQVQPGTAWADKPVNFAYALNTDGEVRKYTAPTTTVESRTSSLLRTADDSGALNGYYKISQLYRNSIKDEDGNETVEFKNARDQTVLIRKIISASEKADTYYVYNKYDQLAFVMPPNASQAVQALPPGTAISDAVLNDLCYQYRYDGDGRLVEKKLPGKGWEYRVYDRADRLILTQDANMKAQNNWLMTKYDQFGRVVYTGIIHSLESRITLQNMIHPAVITELRDSAGFTKNGMTVYYSNTSFASDMTSILSVNYYDTYPPGTPSSPSQIIGQDVLKQADQSAISKNTRSLSLAVYVKNIEDDQWTRNYTWYDLKGRPIATHSVNYLGGYTRTESELDFSGTPKQVVTRHKRLATDTERVITENFTYDHQNRLLVHTHKVDNNPTEYLAQNKYNELSQLETKKVGGNNTSTPLQKVDYQYNIRGWMTKINDPANLGSDLFGYKIKYNQVEGEENPNTDFMDLKVKPRFNGNIAEVDWKTNTAAGDNLRRYGYVYDRLNRLLAGFYQKDVNPSAKEYFEKTAYDLNGNITNLKRSEGVLQGSATAMRIDDLNYSYTGNRLNSVTDISGQYSGYPEASGNPISYDLNGNMEDQKDKGILKINYNILNLPDYYKFDIEYIVRNKDGENEIRNVRLDYLYRADGTKLRKKYTYFFNKGKAERYNSTDYLDGFQYSGSQGMMTLDFLPTSEGYYDFKNNSYIYSYTDHLGNVRLSYQKDGSGNANPIDENNYYPFGLKHEGYNYLSGSPAYQYKYNNKELQTETGMYDYGARFYMPDIGRWGVVDPLAEINRRSTPYNYAINNPIRFIDPDGRSESDWIKKDDKWTYDANITTAAQAQAAGADAFAKNGSVVSNTKIGADGEVGYVRLNDGGTADYMPDNLSTAMVNFSHETLGGMVSGGLQLEKDISHLGNEGGDYYSNLGGAGVGQSSPFFRSDIDKIVDTEGYFGGIYNGLSRGDKGDPSLMNFMVDAMSLIDMYKPSRTTDNPVKSDTFSYFGSQAVGLNIYKGSGGITTGVGVKTQDVFKTNMTRTQRDSMINRINADGVKFDNKSDSILRRIQSR